MRRNRTGWHTGRTACSLTRNNMGGNSARHLRWSTRRAVAVLVLIMIGYALPAWAGATDKTGIAFDIVSQLHNDSQATVWRIDHPNVRQAVTAYPSIRFLPGDQVKIAAGGCVQTGGAGQTWKLYVSPGGPNADRLYHGLIGVPGIAPVRNSRNGDSGLSRLADFGLDPRLHQIPSPLPPGVDANAMFLTLGYEDDGYNDNGYWSHDDGTGGQCKNSVDAFIVLSIGHHGALAPDPQSFIGITPALFRCQAGWAFDNFNTADLSWSSFTNAFTLDFWDYADPLTYVTFAAARGLASGGNCEGMSLLALIGEDQFVVNDIKESFWANYKGAGGPNGMPAGNVVFDINVAHWKQLSSYFLRDWIGSVFTSPSVTAAAIERDLSRPGNSFNYGLLSIAHGFGGHVLVPLGVVHSGNQILIDVYDPNRPCTAIPDTATYPKVTITGDNWSYDMGGKDGVWTGTTGFTAGFGYIPYVGQDGWSDLGTDSTGILTVVFGGNAAVEQVTDSAGRKLFADPARQIVDNSPNGLGHDVARLLDYHATGQAATRPRHGKPLSLALAPKMTPELAASVHRNEVEYDADYGASKEIYVVLNSKLQGLTFSLAGARADRPVRAMIGQRGNFFEMKAASDAPQALHPSLTLRSAADLNAGISVGSTEGRAFRVAFAHGEVAANRTMRVERSEDIPGTAVQATAAPDGTLQVLAAGGTAAQAKVGVQTIGATGAIADLPERVMPVGVLGAAPR